MPTTLIFGGSGKVARHVTRLLTSEEGHDVYSIIRNPAQSDDIKALGATPIVESIEDSSVSDMVQTIRSVKPDFIVWAAGAGGGNPQRTASVDHEGAIKSMDAAAEAGVRRYIIVSALDVRDCEAKPVPTWYDDASQKTSKAVWGAIGVYMKAKLAADRNLRTENGRRNLNYTIVRPGGLSQDPGVGTVAAGKVALGSRISREDVARVVIECMKKEGTVGLAFDVVGGNVPISAAIDDVAVNAVDTFEGYY